MVNGAGAVKVVTGVEAGDKQVEIITLKANRRWNVIVRVEHSDKAYGAGAQPRTILEREPPEIGAAVDTLPVEHVGYARGGVDAAGRRAVQHWAASRCRRRWGSDRCQCFHRNGLLLDDF